MIKLQEIRQIYTDILTIVEKKVFDSYLLNYIHKPFIDEDKLLIIISLLAQIKLSTKEIQNISLSTMLIQIALDTHELVTEVSHDDKNRQLTVLAGDYYSGLYYKILGDSHDIAMIRTLSYGVKEVNEHKVFVYQNHNDIEKLINDIMVIESSLITNVAEYFNINKSFEIISKYLLYTRLLKEKSKYIMEGQSFLFEKLKGIIFKNNDYDSSLHQEKQILAIFDRYLDSLKEVIEKGIPQLPFLNKFLESRITSGLNQHQPYVKTFVEEG